MEASSPASETSSIASEIGNYTGAINYNVQSPDIPVMHDSRCIPITSFGTITVQRTSKQFVNRTKWYVYISAYLRLLYEINTILMCN